MDMHAATDGASYTTTTIAECDAFAIPVEQHPRSAMVPGLLGQLAAMKIARIELMELPNELLIHIATRLVQDSMPELPYPIFVLAGVCTRLRTLYLSTTELWTRIDLGWPPEAIQLSMRCASSQPLDIIANNPSLDNENLQCLSQAQTLRVELHTSKRQKIKGTRWNPYAILSYLEGTDLIELRAIIIRGENRRNWGVLPDFMTAASCANLVTFAAQGICIHSLPQLPVLRTLKIESCRIWCSLFQEFPLQTLTLERLELLGPMEVMDSPDNTEPTMPHVPMPHFRDLIIEADFEEVAMYVKMLPFPSNMLHVLAKKRSLGSSDMPYHTAIMEQLKRFWDRRIGDRAPFPNGKLTRCTNVISQDTITEVKFGDTAWDSPMAYSCFCDPLEPDSPLLDYVTEVRLEYTDRHPTADLLPSDLRMLLHIETLEIIGTNKLDPHAESEVAHFLEDWIVLWKEIPIRTVEFWQCGGAARGLFERLEQDIIPTSVTWVV
jgi:hypothetical protein